ncbi:uncharacterized protein LOC110245425 [Exaiptasia diaphana]|uniref:Uncharacterized protein n=1 Tax=Exaiptasia diaphana TaxID=2652724 RepID=A0A913XMU7_EXADI|nr:uncharacterized protein LOC110245425 [Exaiptasia diaphana]KXJ10453.1 hypothetical protein AC249_AIPGENE5624 [Exaiptasia diaphana]
MKLYLSLLVLVGLVAFCMSAPAADNLEDNPADENLLEDVEAPETDEIQNDEDLDKNAEESEDEAQEDENPVENDPMPRRRLIRTCSRYSRCLYQARRLFGIRYKVCKIRCRNKYCILGARIKFRKHTRRCRLLYSRCRLRCFSLRHYRLKRACLRRC